MQLGISGLTDVATLPRDECCPPDLCTLSVDDLACIMIGLLPCGPLWDEQKRKATQVVQRGLADGQNPIDWGGCTPFAAHSIYTAHRLGIALKEALLPALREASPYTAYETLDDWLDRLGWVDCFSHPCCSPDCAPTIKQFDAILPEKTDLAVKRAIAIALYRAQKGGIRTLGNINWVIEPLGASLKPTPLECDVEEYDQFPCPVEFDLASNGADIECPVLDHCAKEPLPTVSAIVSCASGTVWPTLMAAECIVRSLMPQTIQINRTF